MDVITISGNVGTGARDVARTLAAELGYDYVDQGLLVEAAQRLGVPVERVVDRDERTLSFGERISTILRNFLERTAAVGATDPMSGASGLEIMFARTYEEHDPESGDTPEPAPDVSDKRYVEALATVIQQLAGRGRVVIVGRGSHAVLQDHPAALHVDLVASREFRRQYIVERNQLDPSDAKQRVERADRGRQSYHRHLFRCDADDPMMYHLTLNADRLSQDAIIKAIRAAMAGGVATAV